MPGSRFPGPIGTHPGPAPRRSPSFQSPGPIGTEVRLPTLEVFAALHGDLFAEAGRSLTRRERELAFPIFGSSLVYDNVRVAIDGWFYEPKPAK